MEIIEFYDGHGRSRMKLSNTNISLLDWIEYQNKYDVWICHICGLIYKNVQKFSYHLKKCGTSYQEWKLKYKYLGVVPKCKICGNDAYWSPEHKDYGATCNSPKCFSENSSITAKSTVKIYGDQRNPQCWNFSQIKANGYSNRSDPEYLKLLEDHYNKMVERGINVSKIRHSGGGWGWHSEAEDALMNALKKIYPDLEREIYPPNCNGRFRMDGWIPSLNLYVEEDGEFKRDPNNSMYSPEFIKYIEEKRSLVKKITGSNVKNIWESDVWILIKDLNILKDFIESDIDRSDEYSSTTIEKQS